MPQITPVTNVLSYYVDLFSDMKITMVFPPNLIIEIICYLRMNTKNLWSLPISPLNTIFYCNYVNLCAIVVKWICEQKFFRLFVVSNGVRHSSINRVTLNWKYEKKNRGESLRKRKLGEK
jgi:hypothetical protein